MESNEASTPDANEQLLVNKNESSSGFKELNSEVVQKFDYVKEVAIARLYKTLSEQLDILISKDKCDYSHLEELSKNIFSWSNAEYLKRRKLKNCVWVDVIERHSTEDCLQRFKLHVDLNEIKRFLKLLFQDSKESEDNLDLETLIWNPLKECERLLNILEQLYDENAQSNEMLREQKHLINERLYVRRSSKDHQLSFGVEEAATTAQTLNAIQMRYETNWYRCQTEQALLKSNFRESNLQKRIAEVKFKTYSEGISGDTVPDTYYILVEQIKENIETLQKNFNIKLDEIDNEINYTKSEIARMVEHQKILERQIEEFHEDIKTRLEKDEKDKEKQELQHLKLLEDSKQMASNSKKRTVVRSAEREFKSKGGPGL